MKVKKEGLSIIQLFQIFPNDDAALEWFEGTRWKQGRFCPHCKGTDTYEVASKKPQPYRCPDCEKYFSVTTGTVMQSSKVPLQKWAIAIYLLATQPKGISSVQLAKHLGVTQKTAWAMAQKIREGWNVGQIRLGGTIEVDETYIGGKEKNKHSKKNHAGRGSVGKIPVVGAKQRDGKVYAEPVASTDAGTLTQFILDTVEDKSVVYTDERKSYSRVRKHFYHDTVSHGRGEYVNVDTHTNGIESFWACLKRGYHGTYHYMSPQHLHRYVNEFTGRVNVRDFDTIDQMALMFKRMCGKTLKYYELVGREA
ncbi:MAG: IS1595 family transposase [Caldilineaceae bacterium]|nr:IS1595 family transposase [Caldilineaceae bacterium]